jgi:tripartite-type tricarboxylate transporter receptor subunit TctC
MSTMSGPLQLIVPFEAGGGSDEAARTFARYAAPHFGEHIEVVNRTGASGATGFRTGAAAVPDGRTLMLMVASLIAGPHAGEGWGVDYRDFTPLCLLATVPLVWCVRADNVLRTFSQAVADARARPGRLTLGTAGPGTFVDLSARALARMAGANFMRHTYAGSAAQLLALRAGELDIAQVSTDEALPLAWAGDVRVLAVLGNTPSPAMPNVPTTADHGIDLNIGFFRGIGAPLGLPPAVTEALERACAATAADAAYQQHLLRQGATPHFLPGAAYRAWLDDVDRAFAAALADASLENA